MRPKQLGLSLFQDRLGLNNQARSVQLNASDVVPDAMKELFPTLRTEKTIRWEWEMEMAFRGRS
jgi:hypothetical protein